MPLTYRPFAHAPQLRHIDPHPRMNVRDGERLGSVIVGTSLVATGLWRGGWARVLLVCLGGALITRGWDGRCLAYDRLGINGRNRRAGVPGNSGHRVEAAVEIACTAADLYTFWRQVENLPKVMRHVKSVESHDAKYSHWKIESAAGQTFEWDAEIINEQEGRFIAWQSLPGATIRNAGSVWFEPAADATTRVKVAFEFDSLAGNLGVALASILGISPENDLRDDLERFKAYAEKHLSIVTAPKP